MADPAEVPAVRRLKKFPIIQVVPHGFIVRLTRRTIRFLVFYDCPSETWIAHGLEVDFVSCAETHDDLLQQLAHQVSAQEEVDQEAGEEPFAGFKEAPRVFWRWWSEATSGVVQ